MKRIFLIAIVLFALCQLNLHAQNVPQGINYQTIVRGTNNDPLPNAEVTLQFEIKDNFGNLVYSEEQSDTANSNGLVNLIVGQGTAQSIPFHTIDWSAGPATMTVSLKNDVGGFDPIGTMQLMSVPYALYAANSAKSSKSDSLGNLGAQAGQFLQWNGNAWGPITVPPDADADPTNEIQTLSIAGNQLSLSNNGGSVILPPEVDGSVTNEIQTLSIAGNQLSLSNNGGSVILPPEVDGSVTNEIQTLSIAGNQLSLSNNGGSVILPPEVDGSVTNEIQTLSIAGNQLSLSNNGGSVILPPEVDGSVTNEIQTLSIAGNQLSLSNNGGSVILPPEVDGSVTNEIQTLSIAGNQLSLSNNGGSVILPPEVDGSVTNEIQTLSIAGNQLSLSNNGGSVILPPEVDGSVTNEIQTLSIAGNQLTLTNGGNTVTLPSAPGDNWGNQFVQTNATLAGNGAATPLRIAQQNATNGQVLQWNNGTWAPATVNGISDCGDINSPQFEKAVGIGGTCAEGESQAFIQAIRSTSTVNGLNIRVVNEDTPNSDGANQRGIIMNVENGSNDNDGVIILSRANNGSNGMKIAAQSDGDDATGLRIFAGESDINNIQEDENGVSQNYGIYVKLKSHPNNNNNNGHSLRDIGLYIENENDNDYAAYFNGDVAIPTELEFINPNNSGNGQRWALFIGKPGNNNAYCGTLTNKFIFEYENAVKAVLDNGSNGFCFPSDRRLKENILPIPPVLNRFLSLRPSTYNYKDDVNKSKTFGFIAQDIEPLFPELINYIEDKEGQELLTLNYTGFSVIAIKAIQEQQQIIEAQKSMIENQEARLGALEKEMAEIKNLLKLTATNTTGEK